MCSHRMVIGWLDINVDETKMTDITDIGQNRDFCQNLKISFVFSALNHYKRFLRRLRFV